MPIILGMTKKKGPERKHHFPHLGDQEDYHVWYSNYDEDDLLSSYQVSGDGLYYEMIICGICAILSV